jgi:hypothetical protein
MKYWSIRMETRHRQAVRALVVTMIFVLTTSMTAQNANSDRHYTYLEGQALRVVTEFANGAVVTAVRAADGSVTATCAEHGNDTAKLTIDGQGDVVVYLQGPRGDSIPRRGSLETLPTLDWVNVHLYRSQNGLRKGNVQHADGGTSLPKELTGVATTPDIAMAEEIDVVQSVTTYFEDYVAHSKVVSVDDPRRATFTTVLTSSADGRQEASLRWSAHHRMLQWKVRESEMATVTAKDLPNIPGWEPSLAWANVQAYALAQAAVSSRASAQALDVRGDGVTVLDTAGCDGLHWLDGTIYRPCCDQHDACYAKNGCTWESWWFNGSWSCIKCNIAVIKCFLTAGGGGGIGSGQLRDDVPPAEGWGGPVNTCCTSPIVLDLGDGTYRFTSVADGVQFDIHNAGEPVRMSWTRARAETAFLAMDRNADGQITSGAELFGDNTPLKSGAIAGDGFEALAEFDDNHDGVIESSDAVWGRLLLWIDRNHDGKSSADEVQPLRQSPVVALETARQWVGRRDQWGNELRYMSHFRVNSGGATSRRLLYDVFFVTAE